MSLALPSLITNHLIVAHGTLEPTSPLSNGFYVGWIANGVIAVAFLAVAVLLAVNLTKSRQWTGNILGGGTFVLYLACGGGHLVHFIQLSYLSIGIQTDIGLAARYEYSDWHPWVFDLLTMAAGISYWLMRRKFPDLVSGAAVYEDLRHRQRKALQIHDKVVQGIVHAKLALDLDDERETQEAVNKTLEASKRIIDDLLGNDEIVAGGLRRGTTAGRRAAIAEARAKGEQHGA